MVKYVDRVQHSATAEMLRHDKEGRMSSSKSLREKEKYD
jgi:hypothetical protein